jgi:hypothetical protein
MNKIIDIQREKLDNFYKISEDLLLNLNNCINMDSQSKLSLMDKLRMLNNKLFILEDDINEILYDLKINRCSLSRTARLRLQEETRTNNLINEVSPLLLYYLINRN